MEVPIASGRRIRTAAHPLSAAELDSVNAGWRAANCLSVGQIYLLDNPLLDGEDMPEIKQWRWPEPAGS